MRIGLKDERKFEFWFIFGEKLVEEVVEDIRKREKINSVRFLRRREWKSLSIEAE